MIFVDYPGHWIATALLGLWALLMFLAYRGMKGANTKHWRWVLGSLQYLVILILFAILWNPSRIEKKESTVPNAVLVFFDTSRSMSIVDCEGKSRLDKAIDVFRKNFIAGPDRPQYRIYGFDTEPRYSGSPDSLHRWGNETQLHKVFNCINRLDRPFVPEEFNGREKIAGAIILTDGQAEEKEIGPYEGKISPTTKTIWIGLGTPELRSDIAVTKITAPARTSIRTAVPVGVHLKGQRLGDQPIRLELYLDDHLVGEKELSGLSISPQTPIEFLVGVDTLGSHGLRARVAALPDESNPDNNIQQTLIEVVEPDPMKVLFYSQVANFDIGKVRQALERDKKIRLSFGLDAIVALGDPHLTKDFAGQVRLPKTRDNFFAYDVIILGPCNLDQLEPEQIDGLYSFVVDRGGGLILLPGRDAFNLAACRNPKIRTLLPVEFGPESSITHGPENAISLTPEGLESDVLTSKDLETFPLRASAFYAHPITKPAARTLITCGADPMVCTQRVGLGFVAFINCYGLFEWYREDLQGGLLGKLMSDLTGYTGRVNRLDAGIKLFASRSVENPHKILFEALVYDHQFLPVTGATVILTCENRKIRMIPTNNNRYRAEVENLSASNFVVSAESQLNNTFLGEKKQVFNLPPCRGEMDRVELDKTFLTLLAQKTSGKYFDADAVTPAIAQEFQATSPIEKFSHMTALWTRWPLLVTLCGLLSITWFIKRRLGLI